MSRLYVHYHCNSAILLFYNSNSKSFVKESVLSIRMFIIIMALNFLGLKKINKYLLSALHTSNKSLTCYTKYW